MTQQRMSALLPTNSMGLRLVSAKPMESGVVAHLFAVATVSVIIIVIVVVVVIAIAIGIGIVIIVVVIVIIMTIITINITTIIFIFIFIFIFILYSVSLFCVIGDHCPDPGVPAGMRRTGNIFNIGDKISYRCEDGLILIGSEERTCLESRDWTGQEPACYCKVHTGSYRAICVRTHTHTH